MTTATKTATVTVTDDVTEGGNRLDAGTYTVEMPTDYDPDLVTGVDILSDEALVIVDDEEAEIVTAEAASAALTKLGYEIDDDDSGDAFIERVAELAAEGDRDALASHIAGGATLSEALADADRLIEALT